MLVTDTLVGAALGTKTERKIVTYASDVGVIPPSKVVTRTIADGPLPMLVAAFTRTEYSVKICSPSNVTDVAFVTIVEYSICDEVGANSTL